MRKYLSLLPALWLLAGCSTTATFTHMTPSLQPRNADNQYPVEVAFNSDQQSLRWDSIKAFVLVNGQSYPLRPVQGVKNRWEGLMPVPATQNAVTYRFKFEYLYNSFGQAPQRDTALSQPYALKIISQ